MGTSEPTVWGVHAGRSGDAHTLFLNHGVVALGWYRIGDLRSGPIDRDALKRRIAEAYPDMKPGAVPVSAGQLFRFVREMRVGDVVVYPSKADREIHIGIVRGEYEHHTDREPTYPHRRAVEWKVSVPRIRFSQGALYEIGSAVSLFSIRSHADEFLAALGGRTPAEREEDETIAPVAEEVARNTRDFVLKQLATELKGHPFADFVAHLLQILGYRTRVSPPGADKGIDIVAYRDELGLEPPIIKVQVKSTEGTVGDPETSALYGKVTGDEYGLLVALGSFSKQARDFADSKSNLRLLDGDDIVELLLRHYERIDPRYKALIPLKQVYIPERVDETEA